MPVSYKSETAAETAAEIRSLELQNSRPLFAINFIKKRKDFCQPFKLNESDSDKHS